MRYVVCSLYIIVLMLFFHFFIGVSDPNVRGLSSHRKENQAKQAKKEAETKEKSVRRVYVVTSSHTNFCSHLFQ